MDARPGHDGTEGGASTVGVKACQHCHGQGTVQQEIKPGVWRRVTCPACGGSGKVNTGLI